MKTIYKTAAIIVFLSSYLACFFAIQTLTKPSKMDIKIQMQTKEILQSPFLFFQPSHLEISQFIVDLTDFRVEQILKSMTLEEKVGQMFIWKINGTEASAATLEFLETTKAGGVILSGDNVSSGLTDLTNKLQQNRKIPLFIAIDQEGGSVKRILSDPNPGAQILGKENEKVLCDTIRNTSNILVENGINLNFGIVADIGWDQNSFISSRTFANSPEKVSYKTGQAIICTENIFSTLKHFPGHGRTLSDSHKIIPKIETPYNEWLVSDALPFIKGIEKGADMVMMGHLIYTNIDSNPASLSKIHIDNLKHFGFMGVIITDDIGMLEDSGIPTFEALDRSIDAGNDIILYVHSKEKFEQLYLHTINRVKRGELKEDRIDESVRKILKKKIELLPEQ